MSLKKRTEIMDAIATNGNTDYRIGSSEGMDDVTLYLDIVGSAGYDGLVSFYIIGLNGTATPINALNMSSFLNVTSIDSPDIDGAKFQITVTGWEYFRITVSDRTAGTVTAYITEVQAE